MGPSDLSNSPLLQFQLTNFKKDDFRKLLHSINAAAPDTERLANEVLNKSFERAWGELEQEVGRLEFGKNSKMLARAVPDQTDEKSDEILEELLSIARTQIKILRSPEELLPPNYLRRAIDRGGAQMRALPESHAVWRDIDSVIDRIKEIVRRPKAKKTSAQNLEVIDAVDQLEAMIRYVRHRLYERLPFLPGIRAARLQTERRQMDLEVAVENEGKEIADDKED
jgi:hypothetical protein